MLLVSATGDPAPDTHSPAIHDSVPFHVEMLLQDEDFVSAGGSATVQARLVQFYAGRQYTPAWLQGGTLNADARARLAVLNQAGYTDLLPTCFKPGQTDPAYQDAMTRPSAETAAALDIQLARAFLQYEADHGYSFQLASAKIWV